MTILSSLCATLCVVAIFPFGTQAQVLTDFEDGNIAQWLTEADGVPSLSATGNPGNSLRVTDQAVGVINQVVLPWVYTGDWSSAQATDSLTFDVFAHEISGSLLGSDGLPLISLAGPGGSAVAYIDTFPVFDTWQHFGIALDSASWIVTGSWTALLAEVQTVKIRTEFIDGSEWVQIDNIKLSITPLIEPIVGTICSTWDSAGFYDGWSFQNVANIQVSTTQGNPPGSVRMGDASNALTNAVAAPKFRGDWSDFDVQGIMKFDLYLQTTSSNYFVKDYLVRISGPGGVAIFNCNDSLTALLVNQWHTVEIPIDAASWEMVSGTWGGLLGFVAEIRLDLEFIDGTNEVIYLDNFCLLTDISTAITDLNEAAPMIFPNPSNGRFTLLPSDHGGMREITVMDATGRMVMTQSVLNATAPVEVDLGGQAKGGLYHVLVRHSDGTRTSARVVVE